MEYKFSLDYKGKKVDCPFCGGKKKFRNYNHTETGEFAGSEFGVCDRIESCGANNYPTLDIIPDSNFKPIPKKQEKKGFQYLILEYFKPSDFDSNNFYLFLCSLIGEDSAFRLCSYYGVTNGKTDKWCIFWQRDLKGRYRYGKMQGYGLDGHRLKGYNNNYQTVKGFEYSYKQCFFGEHLLDYRLDSPVIIVESEKTAMIGYFYNSNYIWLASGSATGLNAEKCKVLKGRKVILYPDQGQFEYWSKKANELSSGWKVSRLMESGEKKGLDVADIIIKGIDKSKKLILK